MKLAESDYVCRKFVNSCKSSTDKTPVCTENLIRVDDVMESPKLAE